MERAYIKGFESLSDERVIDELPITGSFPSWLEGSLIRTGPARFEFGTKKLNHWFDGHAMLHNFSFKKGKVSYTNKFLQSDTYIKSDKNNNLPTAQFGTDPCYNIFGRFMSFFSNKRTDNCNVNVIRFGNQTIAMTETPMLLEFNPEDLKTGEYVKTDKKLDGQMTTAHPHFDGSNKALYNYLLKFGYKSKYQFYSQVDGATERKLIGEVVTEKPSYVHSFGMTDNYIILALYPLTVFPLKLKFKMKPVVENYTWEKDRKTRFVILDRNTGKIVRDIETEPFFAFHHINAFEEDGKIKADLAVFDNADIVYKLYLNYLRYEELEGTAGKYMRYEIPLKTEAPVISYLITEADIELPRINYSKVNGKKYQYAYGCSTFKKGDFLDSLVKVDVQTGEFKRWQKTGVYPGEPVFVSAPNATDEDDGVILSLTLDGNKNTSSLLVLDAKSFKVISNAELPHHVPFGFHGQFFRN